jgi:hypothetical protein
MPFLFCSKSDATSPTTLALAALGRAKVGEIDAHPHEVAHMIEQADAHGVTTREEFMLSTIDPK